MLIAAPSLELPSNQKGAEAVFSIPRNFKTRSELWVSHSRVLNPIH